MHACRSTLEDPIQGSIVFVSHDRAFIDRLATRVLDLRGGRALAFDGNYTETAERRAERRKRPEPAAPALRQGAGQVGPAAAAPPESRPARRSEAPAGKEVSRRRRRIASMEERIAALEAEVDALDTRLWEEALTLGPVASRDLAAKRDAKRADLDALVEEWAALSEEETSEPAVPKP